MNLPELSTLGMGAAVAAVAAGWSQVKGLFARFASILIITVELREHTAKAAQSYCARVLRTTPGGFRYYFGIIQFIRPLSHYGTVSYEELGDKGRIFWKGWRPLWAERSGHNSSMDKTVFRFIRGTFDPDKLVATMSAEYTAHSRDASRGNRFAVYRRHGRSGKSELRGAEGSKQVASAPSSSQYDPTLAKLIGWDRDQLGETIPTSNPIDRLALSNQVLEGLAEVQRWLKSKEWYEKRQIPWRRGLLLYGPPGTGKSSLAKALAQALDIPIYLLDISTMDNDEFHSAYQDALGNTPSMILIEDCDAVFDGRENIAAEKGKGLTFDCFLNTISGVQSSDGILLVLTTNHVEKMDPALGIPSHGAISTRPGRIDRAIELPALDRQGREKIARRILADCHESWIAYVTRLGENDTGAQFEERCTTTALTLFWSGNPLAPAPDSVAVRIAV